MTARLQPLLTGRDSDTLFALDRCPLTAAQLLKLSTTFALPFTTERKVRARMQALADSGRVVHRWPYSIAGRGGLQYYTLTRLGYRFLYGPDAPAPAKGVFSRIGVARQQHSYDLAEFIVHAAVAAHTRGGYLSGFCRENSVRFTDGVESVFPDCAFQLCLPTQQDFGFMVELDCGTERVRSQQDVDCWERKIRIYEGLQDSYATRFRVLVVATRGISRVRNILATAARLARNPKRSLFYGITLDAFLASPDAIAASCFLDHQGRAVSLLPAAALTLRPSAKPDPSQWSSVSLPSPSCSGVCSTV